MRVIASSLGREAGMRTARPRADRALARIARSSKPIVAGPWLGEVGFELLYWIPMLRWLRERYGIERERLIAVSRGGADTWYDGLAGRYLDVLDHTTPEDLREWIGKPGSQKPRKPGPFEFDLLERMRPQIGDDYELLHPGLMYALFRLYWAYERGGSISAVLDRSRYEPLPAAAGAEPVEGLPSDYVAVKAYFSPIFPDDATNRAFVGELVAGLAERTEVVLLSTGIEIDDHADAGPGGAERVHGIEHLVTPRNNLEIQTRVIRHARALFATYGGFSYLAPFVGVSSFSFNSAETHNPPHTEVMGRAMRVLARDGNDAGFVMLRTGDVELLRRIAGGSATPPRNIPAR